MARQRSIAELKRSLKRRLLAADLKTTNAVVSDLRSFAVAYQFLDGYSIPGTLLYSPVTKAFEASDVENAIRNQSRRRR